MKWLRNLSYHSASVRSGPGNHVVLESVDAISKKLLKENELLNLRNTNQFELPNQTPQVRTISSDFTWAFMRRIADGQSIQMMTDGRQYRAPLDGTRLPPIIPPKLSKMKIAPLRSFVDEISKQLLSICNEVLNLMVSRLFQGGSIYSDTFIESGFHTDIQFCSISGQTFLDNLPYRRSSISVFEQCLHFSKLDLLIRVKHVNENHSKSNPKVFLTVYSNQLPFENTKLWQPKFLSILHEYIKEISSTTKRAFQHLKESHMNNQCIQLDFPRSVCSLRGLIIRKFFLHLETTRRLFW